MIDDSNDKLSKMGQDKIKVSHCKCKSLYTPVAALDLIKINAAPLQFDKKKPAGITRTPWGHIIFPKCHFTESLFCRHVILPNHCLAEKNITGRNLTQSSHSRIVELPKLHNAE